MQLVLSERFQRDLDALTIPVERASVFTALLALPVALGQPHRHAGLGIRKIHPGGVFEARAGLGLRLVFTLRPDQLILARVGTHDEIRKYLREI